MWTAIIWLSLFALAKTQKPDRELDGVEIALVLQKIAAQIAICILLTIIVNR